MRWWGFRERTLVTQQGPVTFRRGIWHCRHCGKGYAPFDDMAQLPPGHASWTVQTQVAHLGVLLTFRKAVALYEEFTGQTISARCAEMWTEAVGTAYMPPVLDQYTPGPAVDLLFLEVDACMVWFDDGWHEVKTALCWGQTAGEDGPLRYLATEGSWEDLGEQIYQLARRQGLRCAKQVVCLADGAKPIWKMLDRWFPESFQVLDWYHLQEHLGTVAALMPKGKDWHAAQRKTLEMEGPASTLAALQTLATTGETSMIRETAEQCLHYMEGHQVRMDYPRLQVLGYPIGSGRIESACGYLVEQRVKLAGMRWDHGHCMAVLAARSAEYSGDWPLLCQQYVDKQLGKAA
jgi:hypothetical protein